MGFLRRRETAADDQARTARMLDSLDAAYNGRTDEIDDFGDVILSAAGAECEPPYPPPGHTYPRR